MFRRCYHNCMERRVVKLANRWPRGEVPYRFSSEINETGVWGTTIKAAITEIEEIVNTNVTVGNEPCLRFWQSPDSEPVKSYLYFHIGVDGVCGTDHGMMPGRHFVFLDDPCRHKSGVMRMILIALGLQYEHGRPDRDSYVTVHTDNVRKEYRAMYDKFNSSDMDVLGLPYDFESLTHFSVYENANNSLHPTMTSNWTDSSLGNKDRMSNTDVKKLQIAYGCVNDTTKLLNRYHDVVGCSFQRSSCQLTNYVQYDYHNNQYQNQWHTRVGAMPYNGPTGDNSNGRGTYQYTSLSDAWLKTGSYIPPGTYCIHLHYCIATRGNSSFSRVQLKTRHNNVVFAEGHYVSKAWTPLNVTHTETSQWQLWIGSVISNSDPLAVDDVFVTSNACPSI
ncbi:Zinc metalloproteinase nas-14 [Mizuhopecten yessoensis]|uniref:Metalloendopeptidase n=1 Tax=Mizuhopecten yessoensis TaxID=6573 RepID=A0A210QTZ5_MIZYE|nr:Zinc metalloproteinase nas-14 [Mizuhopecten yessoensis]